MCCRCIPGARDHKGDMRCGRHIAGVVAPTMPRFRLLPKGHQLTGQLAMMLVMVAYTFTGLYLLFGG